jgi:hypothetical protein
MIDPDAGTAEIHVNNLHLSDFFTIPNGIQKGAHDPATVSFDASWGGPITRRVSVQDTQFGFAGSFAEEHASVTWSGRNDTTGFSFRADRGNFATTTALGGTPFAEVGFERNGIFFRSDDADGHEAHDEAAPVRAVARLPAVAALSDLKSIQAPQRADHRAPDASGSDQSAQPPSTADRPAAPATSTEAVDQLFADSDGTPLADLFGR